MRRSPRQKAAIALVTTVVVLGAMLGGSAVAHAGVVLGGVSVGGIPVAGLSAPQLMARLEPAARAVERRPLTFFVGKREWVMSPERMGITVDVKATAVNALKAGRQNTLSLIFQSLSSKERKLAWVPRIDRARFAAALEELGNVVNLEASNGDVTLVGAEARVKPPTEGVELLQRPARSEILRAALSPTRNDRVALPVTITNPEIDHAEALRIQQQAQEILRLPVTFTFQSRVLNLPPEKVAPALRVRVVKDTKPGGGSVLALQADPRALREQIVAAAPFVEKSPKDAAFTIAGEKVTIRPSEDGTTVETEGAANALLSAAGSPRRPIELPVTKVPPAFSTADAESLKISSKVASFTTQFDAANVPRVANIDRMASAIDGTVLRPGQLFSLNGTTGPRTPGNGYQEAQIILDGELVPGIGGGVCQVATTLFNAVFTAGLDVVERTNHSLYISKYPLGRDATVNYGAQDLRFRNDTPFGLLLKASVSPKGMTINIYSSPLGRTVQETTSERRNPKEPPVKYVPDPTLPSGVEKVEELGSPGFDVTVTRQVTAGGRTLHSDTFVSKYSPWKRIIRKGTGPAAPPSATDSTAVPAGDAGQD
ncbi:MAG: VanW family protein [Actinomycetota bacterium]|nr:VanW family protein [Actinomycetota bacterium]